MERTGTVASGTGKDLGNSLHLRGTEAEVPGPLPLHHLSASFPLVNLIKLKSNGGRIVAMGPLFPLTLELRAPSFPLPAEASWEEA